MENAQTAGGLILQALGAEQSLVVREDDPRFAELLSAVLAEHPAAAHDLRATRTASALVRRDGLSLRFYAFDFPAERTLSIGRPAVS